MKENNLIKLKQFLTSLNASNDGNDNLPDKKTRISARDETPCLEATAGGDLVREISIAEEDTVELSVSISEELIALAIRPCNDSELDTSMDLKEIFCHDGKDDNDEVEELQKSIASLDLSITERDDVLKIINSDITQSGNHNSLIQGTLSYSYEEIFVDAATTNKQSQESDLMSNDNIANKVEEENPDVLQASLPASTSAVPNCSTSPKFLQHRLETAPPSSTFVDVTPSCRELQTATSSIFAQNWQEPLIESRRPKIAGSRFEKKLHTSTVLCESVDRRCSSRKKCAKFGNEAATRNSTKPVTSDTREEVWCVCNGPSDDRIMIGCDQCNGWFHYNCVGLTITQARRMGRKKTEWKCRHCMEKGEL